MSYDYENYVYEESNVFHGTNLGEYMDGTDGDDTIYGNGGDDFISADPWYWTGQAWVNGVGNDYVDGGEGNDYIDGGYGDDTLLGGEGDDVLNGGWGSDLHDGGPGNDTVLFDYYENPNGDAGLVINLSTNGNSYEQLINIENVLGTQHDDLIVGDNNANILDGYFGNDTIEGGLGDDTLLGGEGDDLLNGGWGSDLHDGGEGNDTVTFEYYSGASTLFIDLTNNGVGYEGFISIENAIGSGSDDWIRGTEGDNILEGGAGNDTLIGNGGFDFLDGGAGEDVLDVTGGAGILTGGEGADTFVFGINEGHSEVTDFTVGEDTIDLSGTGLQFDDLSFHTYTAYYYPGGYEEQGVIISYAPSYDEIYGGYYETNHILLPHVTPESLSASDFIFG